MSQPMNRATILNKVYTMQADTVANAYAALAAENERLRNLAIKIDGYVDMLLQENERLRKAGDKMDAYLKRQDGTTNGMLECRRAWLEAKERGAK